MTPIDILSFCDKQPSNNPHAPTQTIVHTLKMSDVKEALLSLKLGLPLDPMPPAVLALDPSVPHAPKRPINLTPDEFKLALKNSLRYFPEEHHELLAPEFAEEVSRVM